MAAGLGFKDFVTGEVLTAADVDGYLMQGVWVFASAAARDAAVTSPQEGNFAYLKDTNVTTYYTGSAWANLDTTGMTNPMTTTGDTIYSSSGSTPARLGIGSTGQILTVAGGVPTWATPASSGSGLTLIDEVSYSSATTINVNDVFSATYNNYKILNTASGGTAASFTFRLRVSGSDTTTNYFTQLGYASGASAAGGANPSGTDDIFFADLSNNSAASFDILNPYLSAETVMTGTAGYRDGSSGVNRFIFGSQTTSTSFTGFTLLAGTAATGKVSIYGYAKE